MPYEYLTGVDGRINPSSRTFCEKCSERNGLLFAYAHGRPIFLCKRHHKEWQDLAKKDKEMVRQQPFKQVGSTNIGNGDYVDQDRKIW